MVVMEVGEVVVRLVTGCCAGIMASVLCCHRYVRSRRSWRVEGRVGWWICQGCRLAGQVGRMVCRKDWMEERGKMNSLR